MGCCSSNKKIVNKMQGLQSVLPQPSILIEENFKLVDYTKHTENMKNLTTLRYYLNNYEMSDIRCVKRKNEGIDIHSSLVVVSTILTEDKRIEEVCLLVQYSLYGFSISLGDTNLILSSANLKDNCMEMIHLPGSDAQMSGGVVDIIEWAYEHKDEKYMDPAQFNELNMGKRLFTYVIGLLGKKAVI